MVQTAAKDAWYNQPFPANPNLDTIELVASGQQSPKRQPDSVDRDSLGSSLENANSSISHIFQQDLFNMRARNVCHMSSPFIARLLHPSLNRRLHTSFFKRRDFHKHFSQKWQLRMKIGKLKVVQIRKELEARGLDISGTRPALMKRLREALEREGSKPEITHIPERIKQDDPERKPLFEQPEPQQNEVREEERQVVNEEAAEEKVEEAAAEKEVERNEEVREEDERREVKEEVKKKEGGHFSGNLAIASKIKQEERLRYRRERFGMVERNLTPEEAKREELRRFEELKRRRAAKFGPVTTSGNGATGNGTPGSSMPGNGTAENGTTQGISEEERERRLKRQRRFQTIGNATAV